MGPQGSMPTLKIKGLMVRKKIILNVLAIYGHGGHVTTSFLINLCYPFPKRFHIKLSFDWPSGFEKKMSDRNGNIHVFSHGTGTDNLLGSKGFQNHKSSVNLLFCCKFFPLNDVVTVIPIKRTSDQI